MVRKSVVTKEKRPKTSSRYPSYLRADIPFTPEERIEFDLFIEETGKQKGKYLKALVKKDLASRKRSGGVYD